MFITAPGLVQYLHPSLVAPRQEHVLRRIPDEPLPVGDDLERALALLPELDRVRDGTGLADQIA